MREVENQNHYYANITQLKLLGQFLSRTIFAIISRTGELQPSVYNAKQLFVLRCT